MIDKPPIIEPLKTNANVFSLDKGRPVKARVEAKLTRIPKIDAINHMSANRIFID
jgi:hypothetical protein